MADTKITALTALTAADPANDVIPIVDVSDTTMAASGTTKKISVNNILGASGTATLASATITGDLTVDTSTLFVKSSNDRVGIGTITPDQKLEVFTSTADTRVRINSTSVIATEYFRSGTGVWLVGSDSTNAFKIARGSNFGGSADYLSIASATADCTWFDAASGTRMTLNSTGLGIGASPSYKLHVAGTGYFSSILTLGGASRISAEGANALNLNTNSVDRLTIDSSGNVGIGVTPSAWNSSYKAIQNQGGSVVSGTTGHLRIYQNAFQNASNQQIYINSAAASLYSQDAGSHIWFNAASGTAGNAFTFTQAMTLDASGNLLVGTTNTDPTLNRVNGVVVRGNAGILMRTPSGFSEFGLSVTSGIHVYFASDNGTARVYGGNISTNGSTTAYNTTSDYRLKESVQPLVGGLDRINALKPSIYKWKTDGSNGEGFLAHELAEIVPIAVTGEKDAVKKDGSIDAQGVDMSKVIPILVAAIQELTARVQTLEAR